MSGFARRGHLVLVGERRHEVGQERERGGRLGGLGRGGAAGSTDVGPSWIESWCGRTATTTPSAMVT